MEQEKKKGIDKKGILFVIGALLVVGVLAGDSLQYITDWSTAELVGHNAWTIFAIFGGAYMIYLGIKK